MTQSNVYNNENGLRKYLSKTYSTVGIGVAISALLAFITSKLVPILMYKNPGLTVAISFGLIIAELAIAFYFSFKLNTMSKTTAWVCYILYAVVTGLSFSTIIMTYTNASVTLTFVATAIMFICMSIIGNNSKFNYTKVYSLFLPAILAGFIVTLLNVFIFHQAWIDMLIVYIGIILFLVVTAADAQKLKTYYYNSQYDPELAEKLMIMAAFQLYLDFANLFIKILRIFGKRERD